MSKKKEKKAPPIQETPEVPEEEILEEQAGEESPEEPQAAPPDPEPEDGLPRFMVLHDRTPIINRFSRKSGLKLHLGSRDCL